MDQWIDHEQILKNTKVYTNRHTALRGLLGGIGTGNISLTSSGAFCDFEIFGHPDKGLKLPYTFFSIWARPEGQEASARVLEAVPEDAGLRQMYHSGELMGLPRFSKSTYTCHYPFHELTLFHENMPLQITASAFTPFIPLDAKNSGIPGFQLKYTVKNLCDTDVDVSIAGSLLNAAGFIDYDGFDHLRQEGHHYQKTLCRDGLTGIIFGADSLAETAVNNGNLALGAAGEGVTVKEHWQYGGWWDGAEEFWQDFSRDGILEPAPDVKAPVSSERYVGSVAKKQRIRPGEEKDFVFYITWYFPYRYGWWPDGHLGPDEMPDARKWKNYYASQWDDSWDVLCYFADSTNYLWGRSRDFSDALYSSSLGADVIEELVASVNVLRSCTCFRLEDGTFFGWEGCFEHAGSCAGNCTHVWNYAQTLAFLFPELERDMRRTEFLTETDENGSMAFRAKRKLEGKKWDMFPATDGQLGCILRLYRDWRYSGDDEYLKELWPSAVRSMDFAVHSWDEDMDGVLDSRQHNTYDIEFYGITSMTNSIFYAALRAAAQMALYLGDKKLAYGWLDIAEKGSRKMDELLFNGSFYEQNISPELLQAHNYQYGTGCLSDQLFGQELAHLYGLGYLFPEDHVKKAIHSVYKYNFKEKLDGHSSVQRCYAIPDEPGLLLCTWPEGGRPDQPFVYSDEVWTGIELQAAVHLIYEGMTDEAMSIVSGIRKRYDGIRRNPYDEIECGHHYVRSMAAWGLLVALSGYEFNLPENKISFRPRINTNRFTCFYSTGKSWGIYKEIADESGKRSREVIKLYEPH